ncbi:MAG: uracil-DNA glycosylase [Candidatus Firestonebacteria bacterium]|jgi:uracil-DNA glycosylase family 4|nr:uracil-DNA glycosylase [Candidatus Firestonebacteria bacterium]
MLKQKRNPSNSISEVVKALQEEAKQSLEEGFVYFREDLKAPKGKAGAVSTLKTNSSKALEAYKDKIRGCMKCGLGKTRQNFVFGEGDPDAKLVFIGEAPGADEDEQGKPFVGRSGQLLTKIIESIGFKREEVFILNIIKCRPPNNRQPEPEEIEKCIPYLYEQIKLLKPKIICTLGNPSTQTLLNTKEGITKLRGRALDWNGIEVVATFHPSACLRNPAYKVDVWKDVKFLRKEYDRLCGSSN